MGKHVNDCKVDVVDGSILHGHTWWGGREQTCRREGGRWERGGNCSNAQLRGVKVRGKCSGKSVIVPGMLCDRVTL
eukprot:365154-Chlamydomonas_euryale.AAC.14